MEMLKEYQGVARQRFYSANFPSGVAAVLSPFAHKKLGHTWFHE